MGYFLINIETYNDGSADSKAIYTYATQDDAIAAYHSKLGSAMKNAKCRTVLCMVISETGNVVKQEFWLREATDETTY